MGKKQRDKGVPNDSKVTASGTVVTISGTEKKKNLKRYVPRNILPET